MLTAKPSSWMHLQLRRQLRLSCWPMQLRLYVLQAESHVTTENEDPNRMAEVWSGKYVELGDCNQQQNSTTFKTESISCASERELF